MVVLRVFFDFDAAAKFFHSFGVGLLPAHRHDSATIEGIRAHEHRGNRFVKAAYYTQNVSKADSPRDAVITLGHIMNNFDRPYDFSIDNGYSAEGGKPGSTTSEVTLFTWMNDKVGNLYFLRTIDAMNFAKFEIDKLAPIKGVVTVPLSKINDAQRDGTQILPGAAGN